MDSRTITSRRLQGSFVDLVRELSENMRERDKLDLDTCDDMEWALIASLRLSEELYVYQKNKALCVVGWSWLLQFGW